MTGGEYFWNLVQRCLMGSPLGTDALEAILLRFVGDAFNGGSTLDVVRLSPTFEGKRTVTGVAATWKNWLEDWSTAASWQEQGTSSMLGAPRRAIAEFPICEYFRVCDDGSLALQPAAIDFVRSKLETVNQLCRAELVEALRDGFEKLRAL